MSDQTCPLCGEDLYYAVRLGDFRCRNKKCGLCDHIFNRIKIRVFKSQISRIKQQAKQELWDELKSDLIIHYVRGDEIRNKHGVE